MKRLEKAYQDDIDENDQAVKEMQHKFIPKFELIDKSQNEILDKIDELDQKISSGEGLKSSRKSDRNQSK